MTLTITDLNKTYSNGVKALDDFSINITPGMFGLLGPNGAGKSTFMRTLATLQSPDSGRIEFGDIDVLQKSMDLRKVLGYLPQSFGVYPRVSAEKLLDYLAVLKGIASKTQRRHIIEEVLELTNLIAHRKKHVSGYSGGMKQRFGIAQLLLNNPKLIIVDEPTAGLDPTERNRFLNVLRSVGTKNTVIFSTHIVEDVLEVCTDMAVMNAGRIVRHAFPKDAIASLTDQIWTKNINQDDLESYEKRFPVLSSQFNPDHSVSIRVHAQQRPGDGFEVAIPTLEDYYFIALKETSTHSISHV